MLVGDAGGFLDPIFSTGVLLAMQSGMEAAELIERRPQGRRPVAGAVRWLRAHARRRYHHFRRFAVGFYDPAFRDLFFTRSSRFGIYEAVLSVLAGNWRPTLATRLRIALFFALVALQRVLPIAARSHSAAAWSGRAVPAPDPSGLWKRNVDGGTWTHGRTASGRTQEAHRHDA